MSSFIEDGAFVNSIIGEGTKFNGELDLNGLLRIDGDFTGNIKTSGKVLVGKNGRAKCTITANIVVIGGAVIGDIYSLEKIIILSSGIVIGNIFSPKIVMEDGVIFDGNCIVSSNFSKKIEQKKLEEKFEQEKAAAKTAEGYSAKNGQGVPLLRGSGDTAAQSRHFSHLHNTTADPAAAIAESFGQSS